MRCGKENMEDGTRGRDSAVWTRTEITWVLRQLVLLQEFIISCDDEDDNNDIYNVKES